MSKYIVKCNNCKSSNLFLDNLEKCSDNIQCNNCGNWFEPNNNVYELDYIGINKELNKIVKELDFCIGGMQQHNYELTINNVKELRDNILESIKYVKSLLD